MKCDAWSDIHAEVRREVERNWDQLVAEWNALHPDNPVDGEDDEEDRAQQAEEDRRICLKASAAIRGLG